MVAKQKKTKPKKSVERVKNDKSVKADIIATNKEDANQNINKQSVQIIFPADTEIRKVKKKKKRKKTNTERNKLLDQLRAVLQQFDDTEKELRQKNIPIPAELGVPLIKTDQLKTNDDIKNFINDISSKIVKLRELLEKPQGLQATPFGINPLLTRPAYRQPTMAIPQIIPQQPQINIPRVVIPPSTKPSGTGTGTADTGDATQRALQQIAEETKRELERQGKSVPTDPNVFPSMTPSDKIQKFMQISGTEIDPNTGLYVYSGAGSTDKTKAGMTQQELLQFIDSSVGQNISNLPTPSTTPSSTPSSTPRDDFEKVKQEVVTLSQLQPAQRIEKIQDLEKEINDIQSTRLKTQRELDPDFVRTRNALVLRLDQIAQQTRTQLQKPDASDPFPNKDAPKTPREEEQAKTLNLTTRTIASGGKPVKITAPAGFVELFERYRKFEKDIMFNTQERVPAYFHIPVGKLSNLERERDNLENDYSDFMAGLNEQQLAYINARYADVDLSIRRGLLDEIKDTLRTILTQQKKTIKEITAGNERSEIESKAKTALDKGQKLKDDFQQAEVEKMRKVLDDADTTYKTISQQLQTASDNSQVLTKTILNKMLKEIRSQRNRVSDTYEKLPDNAQILVQGQTEEIEFKLQQIGGKLQQILADPKNLKQFMSEESGATPRLPTSRAEDIQIITKYINGERKTFADRVQVASINLFGLQFTNDLSKRSKEDKRTILGSVLDDLGSKSARTFEEDYIKNKQKPFDPDSLIDRDTREKFEADKKEAEAKAKEDARQASLAEGHAWQFGGRP